MSFCKSFNYFLLNRVVVWFFLLDHLPLSLKSPSDQYFSLEVINEICLFCFGFSCTSALVLCHTLGRCAVWMRDGIIFCVEILSCTAVELSTQLPIFAGTWWLRVATVGEILLQSGDETGMTSILCWLNRHEMYFECGEKLPKSGCWELHAGPLYGAF